MSFVLSHAGDALRLAFEMFWAVLWPLALGFLLSAVVETFVSKRAISRFLGGGGFRPVALATAFGAASSSCSYAAVAVARTLFRKGATLPNAIIFEFASTNLVFELGLALLVLLGWQFLAAEFAGGLIMVVLLALIFRLTLSPQLTASARVQAERGLRGKMEGHGEMDMSISDGPLLARIRQPRSLTSLSHYFFMSIYSLWWDVLLGFLIAGAIGAWVPSPFWSHLFLGGHGFGPELWSALIGPLVALLSYVCSVGNVPLAAVLWRNGIGFGGAIAFVFGDLIILPILNIYRKYYGARVAVYLTAVSYVTMVAAGLAVGALFTALGWVPRNRSVAVFGTSVAWDATTFLNIAVLVVVALLLVRFLRTGGVGMLRMMDMPAGHTAHHSATAANDNGAS
ncbi:MAG TPA: permease [Candidatus Dormibacteraeota bacterium]